MSVSLKVEWFPNVHSLCTVLAWLSSCRRKMNTNHRCSTVLPSDWHSKFPDDVSEFYFPCHPLLCDIMTSCQVYLTYESVPLQPGLDWCKCVRAPPSLSVLSGCRGWVASVRPSYPVRIGSMLKSEIWNPKLLQWENTLVFYQINVWATEERQLWCIFFCGAQSSMVYIPN